MQNLQEGYRGSQLRGLECPVRAQVPRPCSVPLALGAGRKNTDEERGLAAQGRGAGGSRGMSLRPSAVRGQENRTTLCPYIPTTPAPRGGSPSRTCMISHGPSAPAGVPVLGIILFQSGKRKFWYLAQEIGPQCGIRTLYLLEQATTQLLPPPAGNLKPSGTGGCRGSCRIGLGFPHGSCRQPPAPHPGLRLLGCGQDTLSSEGTWGLYPCRADT